MRSFRLWIILLGLLTLLAGSIPALATPPDKAADKDLPLDIQEITLDNGLRIFVLERTASPTFATAYQFGVGGAMDPRGRSGIAHLLEHMMFKGTTNIGTVDIEQETKLMDRLNQLWHELHEELDRQADPFQEADEEKISKLEEEIEKVSAEQKQLIIQNEYAELLSRAGAVGLNAFTGSDGTTYIVQLPANRLELWFKTESDRLLNPVFREFYAERDVVMSERRQNVESSPGRKTWEALYSLMFASHPYGNPVLGWPDDIQNLKRDDAIDYFTTYYSPSNCFMVIVGDVRVAEVERLAKKYLSAWQRRQIPRLQVTDEPEQKGERRQVVEFDAEPKLMIGWVTVAEGHPDNYPLDILASILGGLYSSRMDQTIVQQERSASTVSSGSYAMKHGGFFYASGVPREGHTVEELEAATEREIKRIIEHGVSAEELERAKTHTEVGRIRQLKSNGGLARQIGYALQMSGGIDYIKGYEERINAVTAEQVQEVAERYLKPSRKNVVVLRKVEASEETQRARTYQHQRGGGARGLVHSAGFDDGMAMVRASQPVNLVVPEIGKDVDRVELDSGITVFIKEDHTVPAIDMAMSWLGGSNTTPVEQLAAFTLARSLLTEGGAGELDPTALQERKDELGMRFYLGIGSTSSYAGFWSLSRNLDQTFALVLDILTRPRLDPERLETIKGQYINQMQRRYDSPGYGAYLIQNHIFNHDHPRLGYQASRQEIEAITPDDIRRVWQRYLGKDNLYLTVVGDFDRDEMLQLIEGTLGTWRDAEDSERLFITRDPVVRPGIYMIEKELASPYIRITHQIDVDRTAPLADHVAIEILNDILGGSGFRSRLMERVRTDEGMTYGISSYISHQGRPGQAGSLGIGYQTGKETVAQSINSVLEEVNKIIAEEVTTAEVEEQIEAWRNRFIFRYTNDFYSVARLMYNQLDERPYDYDQQELAAVQKVTVNDVQRVAKSYLKPQNLSIVIFGALTEEDRASLAERFEIKVLSKDEVFTGGYDQVPDDETATSSGDGR